MGGALSGVLLGLADGAEIVQQFSTFHRNEPVPPELYLHTTAMSAALFLLAGLVLGAVWAAVPFDPGPIALSSRLSRFVRARGGRPDPIGFTRYLQSLLRWNWGVTTLSAVFARGWRRLLGHA